MTLDAIIFDLDGTLAETDEIHRSAFNRAFRQIGLEWIWAPTGWARLRLEPSDEERIKLFARSYALPEPDARMIQQIILEKTHAYLNLLETGSTSLRPGVARLISEARLRGIKLAICARTTREALEYLVFTHFGTDGMDCFDAIVTADEFNAQPTAEEAYARILLRLDADPQRSIAIEDSEDGVAAAIASGFSVLATPGLYTSLGDFEQANLVVSDLGHPAAPFEVLKGDAGHFTFVTIDALTAWLDPVSRAA